jgi:hypothetical protein
MCVSRSRAEWKEATVAIEKRVESGIYKEFDKFALNREIHLESRANRIIVISFLPLLLLFYYYYIYFCVCGLTGVIARFGHPNSLCSLRSVANASASLISFIHS